MAIVFTILSTIVCCCCIFGIVSTFGTILFLIGIWLIGADCYMYYDLVRHNKTNTINLIYDEAIWILIVGIMLIWCGIKMIY